MNNFLNHRHRVTVLGEILSSIRQTKDLTANQLAARLGTSESFVIAYESGEYRLDLAELVDIADALGIDVIEILDRYQQNT